MKVCEVYQRLMSRPRLASSSTDCDLDRDNYVYRHVNGERNDGRSQGERPRKEGRESSLAKSVEPLTGPIDKRRSTPTQ